MQVTTHGARHAIRPAIISFRPEELKGEPEVEPTA
jgi:hypothetical protein